MTEATELSENVTENAAQAAPEVTVENDGITNRMAIRALIPLLITFVLGTLCLQGFNLVFQQVGADVGAPEQASLITAFPSIVLGIVCFIYGSLGDFVSLRKLVTFGLVTLFIGSVFGFVCNFFFTANLWTVIIARVIQTAGEQVAGSAFLVVATKYLRNDLKVIFFGLFTAAYQLSASIGVFAAGALSAVAWQYLFLIPAVTIFFLPVLLKTLPAKGGSSKKIDAFGFVVFGLATAFLTLFFSYEAWWMLGVSAVLFVLFAVYISKASDPFITPAFFKNPRWRRAISLIFFFYFTNYALSPIYNAIGTNLYGMTTTQISKYLVWAYVVAAVMGTCSGWIVGKIGIKRGLVFAAELMFVGWVGAAFSVNYGFLPLTLFACVYYAGCGMMYSPVVSTVLGTLEKDESGRGVGMNDLIMNVSPSIGIAIIGKLLSSDYLVDSTHAVGRTGAVAGYSNLLLIGALMVLIGMLAFYMLKRRVYEGNHALEKKTKKSNKQAA